MQKFKSLINFAADNGILLLLSAVLAILVFNSSWSNFYFSLLESNLSLHIGKFALDMSFAEFVNDFCMSIFFMLIGVEIKKELLTGYLSSWPARIFPSITALCGVIVPALIFTLLNINSSMPEAIDGWAIPAATDIAFALAVFSCLHKNLPQSLRIFLLALAIIDDLIAVMIIAIFYTASLKLEYLLLAFAALLLLMLTKHRFSYAIFITCSLVVWYCFLKSGVHPTVSGVLLGFTVPCASGKNDMEDHSSVVVRALQPYVSYLIMPVFAFVNSGVDVKLFSIGIFKDNIVLGIMLGLFLGKQIGVFLSGLILHVLKIARLPEGATYFEYYQVSVLCGIGFTMSMFINLLAYAGTTDLLYRGQVGVLLGSLFTGLFACALKTICITKRIKRHA